MGSVWAAGTWAVNSWATGTWADIAVGGINFWYWQCILDD